jgi:hypothetical protein
MKILLHICCGVCAAGTVKQLKEEGYEVTGFYYNPNIYPEEEYFKRLDGVQRVSEKNDFKLIIGNYNVKNWFDKISGTENEKESGKRCNICFQIRLEETFNIFKKGNFDFFTTTLTISPHKKSAVINHIGKNISKRNFLVKDFKKREGFKQAIREADILGLYRQDYCGCIFSRNGGGLK